MVPTIVCSEFLANFSTLVDRPNHYDQHKINTPYGLIYNKKFLETDCPRGRAVGEL